MIKKIRMYANTIYVWVMYDVNKNIPGIIFSNINIKSLQLTTFPLYNGYYYVSFFKKSIHVSSHII